MRWATGWGWAVPDAPPSGMSDRGSGMPSHVEVVAPRPDLVSFDLERPHDPSVDGLAADHDVVDAFGQDNVARDREVDHLCVERGGLADPTLDRPPDLVDTDCRPDRNVVP